jgi:hypothetical protein
LAILGSKPVTARFVSMMAEYPEFSYPLHAVRKAGARLSGRIENKEEAIEIFAVANSWRDSHILPMRSIRASIIARMRALRIKGETAARPKRMPSIRRKLRESTIGLDQMNDLGGCRAILNDGDGVKALIASLEEDFPHQIRQQYPYISRPKADGYRSHHVVFTFDGKTKFKHFTGRRVELQIRTRLQHSWATAVEAVELFRGEDLKHGRGSAEWLRLFALVSGEFSYAEDCPVNDSLPDRDERIKEIKEICASLNAIEFLENIKNATHYVENYVYSDESRYFIIHYRVDHIVTVESYENSIAASARYAQLEGQIAKENNGARVVVVEVDRIEKLVDIYPNYFGDVSLFVQNIRKICSGGKAIEYSMAPQQIVKPRPHELPDPQLLRRRYTRWTD